MTVSKFRTPVAVIRNEAERRLLKAVREWQAEECEDIEVLEAACAWADYLPKPRRRRGASQ